VAWLERLWGKRYRVVPNLHEIGTGRVEISGIVQAVDLLRNPVSGEPCVAMEYRAWPPSTTVATDGATAHGSRAYQIKVRQATSFVLGDDYARVLVQVPAGVDIEAVHEDLLARHGVGLRTEVEMVQEGERLHVVGRVTHTSAGIVSPHRAEPHAATVAADRFWTD
jgi:hypothetical protein